MLGIIFTFFLIYICVVLRFYYKAKPKHRREKVDLYWWFNNRYGTLFPILRAYQPLLNFFEKRSFGFGTAGSRIFVINEINQILLCTMNENRRYGNIIYDLGAGGAIQSKVSPEITALEELEEELGIKCNLSELKFIGFKSPADGYHCLIYHYILKIKNDTILKSKDNTYVDFNWLSKEELKLIIDNIRDDPVRAILIDNMI